MVCLPIINNGSAKIEDKMGNDKLKMRDMKCEM